MNGLKIKCLSPLFLLLFIGCATAPQMFSTPEKALRARVTNMMQAKLDGRWDLVYNYFEKAYKKTISQTDFGKKPRDMVFHSYKIESINIDPNGKEAEVRLVSTFSIKSYRFDDAPDHQKWKIEGGKWVMEIKDLGPFHK